MYETMGGGYAYSLNSMLGGLLMLSVKLLVVALVAAVIVGIVLWIKNTYFKDAANNQILKAINADPALKTIGGTVLAIVVILLIVSLLQGVINPGFGLNTGMGGYNISLGMSGLLNFLLNILMFVLIISLILAVITYLKQQFDKSNQIQTRPKVTSNATTNPNNKQNQ